MREGKWEGGVMKEMSGKRGGSFIDLCLWGNLHFLFLMSVQPNGVNLWYLKL